MDASNQKRVLIIEDEKPIARALELKLTHEGLHTTVVSDGEEGLKTLENENFDLVVSDLVMPKMDGFEVLQKIKEKGVDTPIIVLTNLSQEEDKEKALALGAKDLFIKSNTPITEIVEHVKQALA